MSDGALAPTMRQVQQALDLLQSTELFKICYEGSDEVDIAYDVDSCSSSSFMGDSREHARTFASVEGERWFYAYNVCGAVAMIAFVALIAGLFLGLLTLDPLDLQIIQRTTIDDDERRYAAGLYPIVVQRHLLLVTLLILNSLAYEALPIFLDALVPAWVAIVLSTTLILLFGEILPSAIFTGPSQMMLGYHLIPITRFFLFIMYPFARPCSAILDAVVHPEGVPGADETKEQDEAYNREELAALVKIQFERRQVKAKPQPQRKTFNEKRLATIQTTLNQRDMRKFDREQSWGALKQEIMEAVIDRQKDEGDATSSPDNAVLRMPLMRSKSEENLPAVEQLTPPMVKQEVDLVVGALQMRTKVIMDVFTPLRLVHSVPEDLVLDRNAISDIYAMGYSRVPVYHRREKDANGEGDQNDNSQNDQEEDEDDDKIEVMGILMVRQLMLIDWSHQRQVQTLPLQRPEAVSPRLNLVDALKLLRTGGSHMAFVCARPDLAKRALSAEKHIPVEAGFMGIVTLEDIMESIMQDRIYDESDIKDRDRAVATLTKWAAQTLQNFARRRIQRRRRVESAAEQQQGGIAQHQQESVSFDESTPLLRAGFDVSNGDNSDRV